MSKLCPHFQTLPSWLAKKGKKAVPLYGSWVKVLDPGRGIANRFPGKKILGRFYVQDEDQYVRHGAEGAEAYFWALRDKYNECRMDVYAFEAINEIACNDFASMQTLAAFCERWIELMHTDRLLTCVWACSMGRPELIEIDTFRNVFMNTDYWSLHPYAPQHLYRDAEQYSLRHRWLIKHMLDTYIRVPPLLLTEVGIDRGGRGWKGYISWPEYLHELQWYESEIAKDPQVEAAFLFSSGTTDSWKSFDIGEAETRELAKSL